MTAWKVKLDTEREVTLTTPFGHQHSLAEPGAYRATVILSPINQRVQVLSFEGPEYEALAAALNEMAEINGYGKIWMKAPASAESELARVGYEVEGRIPGFFNGSQDALSMARFVTAERRHRPTKDEEDDILAGALAGEMGNKSPRDLPAGYSTSIFQETDAEDLAALYSEVFPTYPYPIDDPEYLCRTARTHVVYRLVRNGGGQLVAAASAETFPKEFAAEMTDFASLPSERGKGLAQFLLRALETDAASRFGIKTNFTIARALSFGMLRTFHNCGYALTGTLVNNCNIAGKFETMHIMTKV